MNATERRAMLSLASVMSLRMIGLFMILPVFTLYAHTLLGATPTLIGVAMGIYGLTQALFQIPFGILSDHVGRKKMITLGLAIFATGSILAGMSHTITMMIIGRALQGVGAVGSTIIALLADLTREEERTKAMAGIGMTIGASFSLAFILGPLLTPLISVSGLFGAASGLSIVAIFILIFWVPSPVKTTWHADAEPDIHQFSSLLKHRELSRLNIGIFILHAILTATFVVIPISLHHIAGLHGNQQWLLYLPILILAFACTIPFIIIAEKMRRHKQAFLAAIALLGLAELLLWFFHANIWSTAISLWLFFTAFSALEAFLPSMVSRTAPRSRKGTALGIYSCSQFLGIFVGGALGGWLYGTFGIADVYFFCVVLTLVWLAVTVKMQNLQKQQ